MQVFSYDVLVVSLNGMIIMFDSMRLCVCACLCFKVSTTLIKLTMDDLPGLVMNLYLACGSRLCVCVYVYVRWVGRGLSV